MKEPRLKGTDYNIPDPVDRRCPRCNSDGMNRTGLKPIAYIGACTTGVWGRKCCCDNGLIIEAAHLKTLAN